MDELAGFVRPPEGFEHEFVVTNPVVRRDGRLWVGRLTGWDPESAEPLPEGREDSIVALDFPVRVINEGQVVGLLGSRLAGPVLSVLEGSGRLRAMLGGWPVASNGARWSLLSPQEFLEASTLIAERARAQILEIVSRSESVDSTHPAARIYSTFEGVSEEDRLVLLALLARRSGDDRHSSVLRLEYKKRVGVVRNLLLPLQVRVRRLERHVEQDAARQRNGSVKGQRLVSGTGVQATQFRLVSQAKPDFESRIVVGEFSIAQMMKMRALVARRRDLRKLGNAAEEPNVGRV